MKKDNLVAFRISLYETDTLEPQELYKKLKSKNCINSKWIPQTQGSQIWMWFEFANIQDKNDYIENLNITWIGYNNKLVNAKDMFMHDEDHMTQETIDRWAQSKSGWFG